MKRYLLKSTPFLVFTVFALFLWRGLYLDPQLLPAQRIGQRLPEFELPLLDEQKEGTLSSTQLKGQVALLNVWASWCAACEDEQVFLMSLANQGFPVFGLNYKDHPDSALRWLKEWGNPYLLIAQDKWGKTAIDLGVYGTPESFLIDKHGNIVLRHVGVINETIWKNEFEPLLEELRKKS